MKQSKGIVIMAANKNPDYHFFIPIVEWMWAKFGWTALVIKDFYVPIGIRQETVVQCSRLYVGTLFPEDTMIMTSDIDMLPLSDYWNPNPEKITCYGRDLTDYHYPICYIAMTAKKWTEVMQLTGDINKDMARDFDLHPKSRSAEWTEWWQVDQDIITERINKQQVVYLEERGLQPNGYPLGRIDRGCWEQSLQHPKRIDAHLLRPGYTDYNFEKIIALIQSIFPNENLAWMREYRDNYIKTL